MTGLRARRCLAGLSALLVAVVAGCTGDAPKPAGPVVSAKVVASRGASLALRGVSVGIPAGALSADTTVTVSDADPPSAPPGAVSADGDPVHVDIGTAQLVGPITLTLPLRARPATPDAAGLAYFDDATRTWQPVAAQVDVAAGTITATVSHLSWWQPWSWNLTQLETTMATLLTPIATFRADLPHCAATPPGVKLTITGGRAGDPALDGCVEAAKDGLRVKLVNNRSYATIVGSPPQARFESGSRGGLDDAVLQLIDTDQLGGYYLPAGGTVSYLTDRSGGDVYFTAGTSWLTFMITTAADFALALAQSKEADSAHDAGNASVQAVRFDAGLIAQVGKCLADEALSDPPTTVTDALRLSLGCLDLLATSALDAVLLAPLSLLQTLIVPIAAAYDTGQDDAANGHDSQAVLVRGVPAPACPTAAQIGQAVKDQSGFSQAGDSVLPSSIVCAGPWVRADVESKSQGYQVLLHQTGTGLIWQNSGTGPLCTTNKAEADDSDMTYVPAKYGAAMNCIID